MCLRTGQHHGMTPWSQRRWNMGEGEEKLVVDATKKNSVAPELYSLDPEEIQRG